MSRSGHPASMGLVYLITHPDVIIDSAVPVPRWPLSARGRARMKRLVAEPWIEGISAIYCSTEQKAVAGAELLARYLGIEYEMVEELGEIDRSATGYLPRDEQQTVAEAFFARPDTSIRGWETARGAQRRIVTASDAILEDEQGRGNVAIVSHGAVGTLYRCRPKGVEIGTGEAQPGAHGGNYYCFRALSRSLVHGWKPIDGC